MPEKTTGASRMEISLEEKSAMSHEKNDAKENGTQGVQAAVSGNTRTNSAPAVSADEPKDLSIDSIGWLFIQKYYSTYTSKTSKLFAFYDAEASFLHDDFPSESGKKVHLASGVEAIKAHFAQQTEGAEKNKIVVDRADFQWSGSDRILIVVSGCWKKGDSMLWQFVQTFVLKAKERTVYDVCNDVLRFVDYSEVYVPTSNGQIDAGEKKKDVKVAEETEVEKEQKAEEKTETKEQKDAEPKEVKDAKEPKDVKEQKEAKEQKEPQDAKESKVPKTDAKAQPEISAKDSEAKKSLPESPVSGSQTPSEKPATLESANAPKQTWATLAAIEPKVSTKSATVASPIAAKSAPAPSPVVKKPSPPAAQPVKFKREEWYPIYIRNIDVEEEELKNALIKQFGDIKYFRKSNKTALCDFRNKADQIKALDAKEIVVGSNTIYLEPRLQKVFGKPDPKKDKKQVKKNGTKPKS